ncbi:MAG: cytochrome c [Gammaproteobacteria bacterium]|nr:cytochrome c [Gammaproteobacteria bacterium]MDP6537484.1 cytochrome c [Gammaproteobacteria bacterium]MDP6734107.1 cytochrome c [Gammaproteobacteria bacterium]
MSMFKKMPAALLLAWIAASSFLSSSQETVRLGTPISEDQLENFDLVAPPDGSGFPTGNGTARQGKAVFDTRCATCHGSNGEGTSGNTIIVGGDMHSEENPLRTVGSFWPYASTIFDYVRRAMPANAPKSLSNTEVYQVTAYVLFLNGIIDEDTVLNSETLQSVEMPNADGFIDRSHIQ